MPDDHPAGLPGGFMTRRQAILIAIAGVAALVLAFPLRPLVQDYIIMPVMVFIWALSVLYRSIPQAAFWIPLLALLILMTIGSFYTGSGKNKRPDEAGTSQAGMIQRMAVWIEESRHGVYFKWRLARLLAELAQGILVRRLGHGLSMGELYGHEWDPPPDVQDYLQSALKTTYADYPRSNPILPPPRTPFDRPLEPVIEYLESQMENEHESQHS